jgi:starch synthase
VSSPDLPTVVPRPRDFGDDAEYGLALASRGDALTPYLFAAAARRFRIAGEIDPELSELQRYVVAALTIRPTRSRWVERFYKSSIATRMRSANASREMSALRDRPDGVLQVHALFSIPQTPSFLYVDCTHAQSAKLWPAWNPLSGRALRGWYKRERRAYEMAQHIFAFSVATKLSLIEDYGLSPEKVTVTGAGVNFPRLPEIPVVGSYHGQEPPSILFVGNDFTRKGGPLLLEAFSRVREIVPEARLKLVGLKPKIAPQPGVDVIGFVNDRSMIADLYRHATVFALPSIFDPFPLAALEAMSFELPVVATRQMGTPEMIDDGVTGRLVEPGDVDALAFALIDMLLDPKAASSMGKAARRDIEQRFTWDAVVDRMAPALRKFGAQEDR